MAKIIYSIQSDGMGHALRSKPVIEHLIKKGHKVKILTSRRAYVFLKQHFKNIEEIDYVTFTYRNNKVNYTMTALRSIPKLLKFIFTGFSKIKKIMTKFNPDLVISDFEPFSAKAANILKIPLISIDNMTIISLAKTPVNIANVSYYIPSVLTIKAFTCFAQHYFVTSFFRLPLKKDCCNNKITIVHPILRDEIIKAKKKAFYDGHVLIYQTTSTNKNLIPTLMECKTERFIYYGCDQNKRLANIAFKKFSESSFIKDLASAKAVILNGGFTLMSEAIFLGKPVLSNPIAGQYEQILNSIMLESEGYGMKADKLTPEKIRAFLSSLPEYKKHLSCYDQNKNNLLFSKLDKKIKEITKGV
jgi:uncharacterized protein (TIGR00661 family)